MFAKKYLASLIELSVNLFFVGPWKKRSECSHQTLLRHFHT